MMQSSALRNRSPPRPPGTAKLPDPVIIREYREDDAPAFIGLIRELQSYELPFTRHLKRPEDIGAWYVDLVKQQCAKLDGIILMAECASQCLGCAVVYLCVENQGDEEMLPHIHAHVGELIVTAGARGKGIGTMLLTECERLAKFAGRAEITLAVGAGNDMAHQLYRRSGYEAMKIRMSKLLA